MSDCKSRVTIFIEVYSRKYFYGDSHVHFADSKKTYFISVNNNAERIETYFLVNSLGFIMIYDYALKD